VSCSRSARSSTGLLYGRPVIADRGIGGTVTPAEGQIFDWGTGGTGIVGVATGFASICVDGVERDLPTKALGSLLRSSPAPKVCSRRQSSGRQLLFRSDVGPGRVSASRLHDDSDA
jgi:hypothetical protein